ncbi:MAG TPA: cytochrome c oxidase subunit II [Candidatus Thermoplasmatota archaeon]|nr:cytochrome c oxidase subunit II [Candidatus Thermoplasmatota archaeon]
MTRTVRAAVLLSLVAIVAFCLYLFATSRFAGNVAPAQQRIEDLFYLVLWIAIAVFVLVEAWLLLNLFLWHEDGQGKVTHETHRGNHSLEVAWTIPPVVVFLTFAVLSAQALDVIERTPEGDNVVIDVAAGQWLWTFTYPDGTQTSNELWVRQNETVVLRITSTDVIHAVYVREFGLKIDAMPGTTNTMWFRATKPGTYVLQCAEYCGGAHSAMLADVHVFPAGENRRFGPAPAALQETPVSIDASGRLSPGEIRADQGQTVRLNVTNEGRAPVRLTIGAPYNLESPSFPPGASVPWRFLPAHDGTFDIQREDQAAGRLIVRKATVVEVELRDFTIVPKTLRYEPDTPYAFHVRNLGDAPHNFYIGQWAPARAPGKVVFASTPDLRPGQETWLNVTLPAPRPTLQEYWCDVPGHYLPGTDQDMHGTLDARGATTQSTSIVPMASWPAPAILFLGLAAAGAVGMTRRRRKE